MDTTERDALAWRLLEERLDMIGADLPALHIAIHQAGWFVSYVIRAVNDSLAHRRQT